MINHITVSRSSSESPRFRPRTIPMQMMSSVRKSTHPTVKPPIAPPTVLIKLLNHSIIVAACRRGNIGKLRAFINLRNPGRAKENTVQRRGKFSDPQILDSKRSGIAQPSLMGNELGKCKLTNRHVVNWVQEQAIRCQADIIFWCDGSEAEKTTLTRIAVE